MKIYFAGSITGGRDDQSIYLELINHLKTKGQVLTEHIANKELTSCGELNKLTPEQIFTRDSNWIRESDIVIAEVTQISLGVGYELGLSENLNKKVICLYRPRLEKKLSAMISGNKHFIIKEYETIEEAKAIIDEIFK